MNKAPKHLHDQLDMAYAEGYNDGAKDGYRKGYLDGQNDTSKKFTKVSSKSLRDGNTEGSYAMNALKNIKNQK